MRFPEFTGEWERTKLCKYLQEHTERNKRELFSTKDVLSVSGDWGIVNQIELLGRSFAGKSVRDYHVVRTGNVVYTKSPLKEYPYGIIKVNKGIDGIVSTLYAVYDVKNNADGIFIEYYFSEKGRINRYLKPIVRIGAKHDMKIGNEEVLQNYVSFPKLKEQHKIASFIEIINERIATQSRIIEDLEQLKSAIYHRVFSTIKGKTVVLKSIAYIVKGKQLNGTELSENGNYYVMNGGIVPSGYYHEYNTPANTISISEGGNSCGYVQFNCKPFWSGGHCYTLHISNKEVNLQFLYHFLKYREKNIMALRIGSGLPNIQKKDLGNFSILLPAINEQNKAVCLFDTIQQKADVDTKLLNQLLVQKQYLLQQMFI